MKTINDFNFATRASVARQLGFADSNVGHVAHISGSFLIAVGEWKEFVSGGAANGAGEWRGKRATARVTTPNGVVEVTLQK